MNRAQNKKICILVKRFAGHGRTVKRLPNIWQSFKVASIDHDTFYSEYPGYFLDFITNEKLEKYDGLVVVGGDGTIHEVVNGLMKSGQGSHLPLGVIPGGSGNAFADDLGIKNSSQAIKQIVSGQLHSIDIMRISRGDNISYAFNIIAWGIASDVNIRAEKLRRLGNSRYSLSAIISILNLNKRPILLHLDNDVVDDKVILFVALNTVHTGKGMKMAPHAKLNDGFIDLLLLKDASRLRILKIFIQLFSGKHITDPLIEYRHAKTFSIQTKGDRLNIDGENIGQTPIEVSLIPSALKVFTDLKLS
jgi:YegS/Rv2252/BmrU family lipid kinase